MCQLELKFGAGDRNFEIKMNGIEESIQLKILELCMTGIKEEAIEEQEESKEKEYKDIESGYQLFKQPMLETKEEPKIHAEPIEKVQPKPMINQFSPDKSIRTVNGRKHYQLFYRCPDCGKSGKHYITPGIPKVQCSDDKKGVGCSNWMNVRQATMVGFPNHDEWGNYYVAGDFKKSMKDKEDEDEVLNYGSH